MKKSRFTESQIVAVLKEGDAGVPVAQLVRKHGISTATYYNWRSKYAGVDGVRPEAHEGARGGELEAQADVRRPGARERSDQGRLVPKTVTPSVKRQVARGAGEGSSAAGPSSLPDRRAVAGGLLPNSPGPDASATRRSSRRCSGWSRSTRAGASGSATTGCGSIGHRWNHKRVHRVYCALRLNLPRRAKRRVPQRLRQPLAAPAVLNGIWALDFMHDALYGGRRFRTLNVLDEGNREGLAIEVGTSIPSTRVVRVLEQLIEVYGRPAAIRVDNGPELTAQTFVDWCARHTASSCATSSRASPTRTPTSSGSTAAIARRC